MCDSHYNLVIDLRWQASLDVHESLQQELLSNELELLLLVLLFNEVDLLETVQTLTCLEIYLAGELKH